MRKGRERTQCSWRQLFRESVRYR